MLQPPAGMLAPADNVTELAVELKVPPHVVDGGGVLLNDRFVGKVSEKSAFKVRADAVVLPKLIVMLDVALGLMLEGVNDLLIGREGVIAIPIGARPIPMVVATVLVLVSITEMLLSGVLVTYAKLPSGIIAIPDGLLPTAIGEPTTVLELVSITETVLVLEFATYAKFPLGVIAIPVGPQQGSPNIKSMTVLLVVSITETVLFSVLVT
jgi:hypothetical protein